MSAAQDLPLMSRRLVLALVSLAAVSSVVLIALYTFGPELSGGESSGSDVLSTSAVGFAGLEKLLTLSKIPTRVERGMAARTSPSLTILTPTASTPPGDMRAYRMKGPILIILPKWMAPSMPGKPEWVTKVGAVDERAIMRMIAPVARIATRRHPGNTHDAQILKDTAADIAVPATSTIDDIELLQIISGTGPVLAGSVLTVPGKGALLVKLPRKGDPVYVLSEPDLMNNHGLSDEDTARLALTIVRALRRGDGPVSFDVTLDGLGSTPNLWRSLLVPPFLGSSLAALIAALLIGLHAMSRFGAPERAARVFAYGKTALADNSASLIRMMKREHGMAQRYVASMRELALARLDLKRTAPAEQDRLLAALEKSAGLGTSYGELAREAQGTRTSGDLLRIARKAYAWKQGVTSGN